MAGLVESEQTLTGSIEPAVADDFANHTSSPHWFLHTKDGLIDLSFIVGVNAASLARMPVSLTGIATAHAMAVESAVIVKPSATAESLPAVTAAGTPLVCSTTGAQNIAAIIVNFPAGGPTFPTGMGATPYWTSQYSGGDPSLNTYWQEVSNGQTSAAATIFGPYNLSQTYNCNQTSALMTAALQAVAKDIDFSKYNRYTVIFPVDNTCWFGGLATIGCGGADSTVPQPYSSMWAAIWPGYSTGLDLSGLLDHEHGHNLGLNHSNSLDFGSIPLGAIDYTATNPGTISPSAPPPFLAAAAPVGSTAVNTEYGDPFSVMGSAYTDGPYHAFERFNYLNWLPSSATQVVTTTGTYTIDPVDTSSGTRALRVLRDPFTGSFLWLEYRQPTGYYEAKLSGEFSGTDLYQGALVHYENGYVDENYDRHTFLLDFNPVAVPNNFDSPDLTPGATWSDPYTLLDLTVNSANASGLSVTATWEQPCATLQLSSNGVYPYAGGSGTLTITAPGACSWQVSTADSWITLGGVSSGSGNASIPFTVAASTAASQQQGFITAQRQSIPVIQVGPSATVTSVVPGNGAGSAQSFVVSIQDALGLSDFFGSNFSVGSCRLWLSANIAGNNNWLYLLDDSGTTYLGPIALGTANSISNSSCTLNGLGSSLIATGQQSAVLTVDLAFSPSFAGLRKIMVGPNSLGSFPFGLYTVNTNSITATPAISPASGTISASQTISITDSTPNAAIYYTTDGSGPTTASQKYSVPFVIPQPVTTVRALAVAPGYSQSLVAASTFSFPAAPAPTITPAGGTFTSPQTVTLTDSAGGVSFYYTMDGSTPTTSSTLYTAPFTVSASGWVQAIAAGGSYGPSPVASAFFAIQYPTTTSLTASAKTVAAGGSVTLTATVAPKSGGGTPTGYVDFDDGINLLAELPLAAGTASYTGTLSTAGSHNLTAFYYGDLNFASSTSSAVVVNVVTFPCTSSNPNPNPNPVAFGAPGDFNGDCRSDILWRNTSTGETDMWLMNGTGITGAANLGTIATNWTLAAAGDFNGDGRSDILWRNTSTGEVDIWLMNGAGITSAASLGTIATNWTIAAVGDFNDDGKSDILWRNTSTGEVDLWLMNGTGITSAASLGTIATNWSIVGTGDFNGDGKADILWRNSTTGEVDLWIMNGTSIASAANLGAIATNWSIAGIGDFSGDGKSDILWRNNSTGEVDMWLMNGTAITGAANLGTIATNWSIAGAGDFNGDGKSDILWRNNSTGEVDIWLMNGTGITSAASLGTIATNWQIPVLSP